MNRKNGWKNFGRPYTNLTVFNYLMFTNERYDYDDMINWVIRAFTENEHCFGDTRRNSCIFL